MFLFIGFYCYVMLFLLFMFAIGYIQTPHWYNVLIIVFLWPLFLTGIVKEIE